MRLQSLSGGSDNYLEHSDRVWMNDFLVIVCKSLNVTQTVIYWAWKDAVQFSINPVQFLIHSRCVQCQTIRPSEVMLVVIRVVSNHFFVWAVKSAESDMGFGTPVRPEDPALKHENMSIVTDMLHKSETNAIHSSMIVM